MGTIGGLAIGAALGIVGTLAYQRMQAPKKLAPAGQAQTRMTDFDWGQEVAATRFGVGSAPNCDQWSRFAQSQKMQWMSDNAPVIWNGVRMSMNLYEVVRGADTVCARRQAEAAANQLGQQRMVGDAARAVQAMPDSSIAHILGVYGMDCGKFSAMGPQNRRHFIANLPEFQSAAGSAALLASVLSYAENRVMTYCLARAVAASQRPVSRVTAIPQMMPRV